MASDPISECDYNGHCACYERGDTNGHANLRGVTGRCCFCDSIQPDDGGCP